jgi:hypothetical protein
MNIKDIQKHTTYLFLLLCFTLVVASCDDTSNCNSTRNRSVRAFFKKIDKKNLLVDTLVSRVTVIGSNNYVFYNQNTTSNISLNLNILSNDTSIYYIKTDSASSIITDTLILVMDRELAMVSSLCGFNYSYTISKGSYTSYIIDSIIVENKKVNVEISSNLIFIIKDSLSKSTTLKAPTLKTF